MKYVQTVLGPIAPEEMGFTLPHEHILWDLSGHNPIKLDPADQEDPRNQPLTMESLSELKFHLWEYKDNLVMQDPEVAVRELQWFKKAGGGTICDNTTFEPRSPRKLQEISRRTGVHVVLGTGTYVAGYMSPEHKAMDADELAQVFIRELRQGVKDTDVKCGFIGEIGVDSGVPETSRLSLAAAAKAQKETGAAILIHQPGTEHQADTIFKILTDNGGSLERTVMCHCDPLLPDHDYIDHMAKSGAYISFDFFGLEAVLGMSLWLPTDRERILAIREQIDRGNLKHIVMSHDTAYKCMLRRWGGFGYGHLPKNMVPMMLRMGYEQQWIDQITKYNPQEIFALEKAMLIPARQLKQPQ